MKLVKLVSIDGVTYSISRCVTMVTVIGVVAKA